MKNQFKAYEAKVGKTKHYFSAYQIVSVRADNKCVVVKYNNDDNLLKEAVLDGAFSLRYFLEEHEGGFVQLRRGFLAAVKTKMELFPVPTPAGLPTAWAISVYGEVESFPVPRRKVKEMRELFAKAGA